MEPPDALSVVINAMTACLADWAGHKSYAWAGECGIFADHVYFEALRGGVEVAMDSFDNSEKCDSGIKPLPGISYEELESLGVLQELNHVWLVHAGRHFDAAHPTGVDDPTELNCFRIGVTDGLQRRSPLHLQRLIREYKWWQESANLLKAFESLATAREEEYEPN